MDISGGSLTINSEGDGLDSIEAGRQYTVYTGGTAQLESGLSGEGSLNGAAELGTVTAGEYHPGTRPRPKVAGGR